MDATVKKSFEFHHSSLCCKFEMICIAVMRSMTGGEDVLFGYGIELENSLKTDKILVYFDNGKENKDGKIKN